MVLCSIKAGPGIFLMPIMLYLCIWFLVFHVCRQLDKQGGWCVSWWGKRQSLEYSTLNIALCVVVIILGNRAWINVGWCTWRCCWDTKKKKSLEFREMYKTTLQIGFYNVKNVRGLFSRGDLWIPLCKGVATIAVKVSNKLFVDIAVTKSTTKLYGM